MAPCQGAAGLGHGHSRASLQQKTAGLFPSLCQSRGGRRILARAVLCSGMCFNTYCLKCKVQGQRVQDMAEKHLQVLQPQQFLPSCCFQDLSIAGMLTSQMTVASKSKLYFFWIGLVQNLYEDLKMGPSRKQLFLSEMS